MSTFRIIRDLAQSINPDEDGDPLDAFIDAMAGERLPGIFGLGQAWLHIWTKEQPMPGSTKFQWVLWGGKALLNSGAAWASYYRGMDPEHRRRKADPLRAYVEAKKLRVPDELDSLDHMIFEFVKDLPYEVKVLPTKDHLIRITQFPNGVECAFTLADSNPHTLVENGWFRGHGPFIHESVEPEHFFEALARAIWEQEEGSDLEIVCHKKTMYGEDSFKVAPIGVLSDYVSEGAENFWSDVNALANRCKAFQEHGLSRRILLQGPPGTGKTTLGRSLARVVGEGRTLRIEAKVIERTGSATVSKFIRLLRPRVVILDDLDRASDTSDLLHYLEDMQSMSWAKSIIVIGTVNTLSQLDPALLRPGRFDEIRNIPEPNDPHRRAIIRHYLKKFKSDYDVEKLTHAMHGWAPADIREVIACLSIMGFEYLDAELERVELQRQLYSGNAVELWLQGQKDRDE